MGVGADDSVGAVPEQEVGQFALFPVLGPLVLVPPVHGHQDKIGFCGGRLHKVLPDLHRVDQVDDGRGRDPQSVGPVGVVEQGDADPVLLHHQRIIKGALPGIRKGTRMQQSPAVQLLQGPVESLRSAVQRMVVGHYQDVEPGVFQCVGKLIGTGELRVALVGRTGQGDLQVADHHIGLEEPRFEVLETGMVVVPGLPGGQGRGDLGVVPHDVAGEEHPQPGFRQAPL